MTQYFSSRDGVMHCESTSLVDLAEQYGTPLYVYSRAAIEASFQAYAKAFEARKHLICYAVKANSNLAVLSILARLGSGFDIVSQGELERVVRAGGDPARVVFSGVDKQSQEIARAIELNIKCFNVESAAELDLIQDVAASMNAIAPISIRVNPDVDANTHPYISTGLKDNKFGVPVDQAIELYQRASGMNAIRVEGIDCHIGSQLTELAPFVDALDRVVAIIDHLASMDISLSHVDLGGGLGIQYGDETPPEASAYVREMLSHLGARNLEIILEPGRSIVGNAGMMLTQVDIIKQAPEKCFAIVDAAMNDLLRPALYSAWQNISPLIDRPELEEQVYDVVGPVCETGDFLGKERSLRIKEGDFLAVASAGAYGFVMSSNYNTRNRAAEVLVDGDQSHLARARETYEDQMRLERVYLPDGDPNYVA